jgi:gamma-glutamyltranspeptidase/glutathione hydrolase
MKFHVPFQLRVAPTLFVAALLAACATAPAPGLDYRVPDYAQRAPEAASGYTEKPGWSAQKFMVAAANPLATDTGYQVLKAGGSAIDAAIAVQMVLALVEPQSSGIGGGLFLVHHDGTKVQAYDGRETAPAAAATWPTPTSCRCPAAAPGRC